MERKITVEQHGSLGVLWLIGWLFSIGFLKMSFWRGVLALFVWPYFLGAHFAETANEAASAANPAALEEPARAEP